MFSIDFRRIGTLRTRNDSQTTLAAYLTKCTGNYAARKRGTTGKSRESDPPVRELTE